MKRNTGFTIIELLIVVTIIAIIGTIAVSNLLVGKALTNERMALVTLKQIQKAQVIFQQKESRDKDLDRVGEYATTFEELTGVNTDGFLSADAVNVSWINMLSTVGFPKRSEKDHYIFQILTSVDAGAENVDDDEEQYIVVGWPKKAGKVGQKAYVVTEAGNTYVFGNALNQFDGATSPITLADVFGTPFDYNTLGAGLVAFVPID